MLAAARRARLHLVVLLAMAAALALEPQPATASAGSAPDASLASRLHAVLQGEIAGLGIPGAVAGVWVPGQLAWQDAVGTRNLESGTPMRIDDVLRVGSVTKTFTATVLLELADRGLVRLDDPIARYVPGVPNGDAITLRELANMTSGLFDYSQDVHWALRFVEHPYRPWRPRELLRVAFRHPPLFAPGGGWSYSNTNYVLLGLVIERVTGEPFPAVLQRLVLDRLGLAHTGFGLDPRLPRPFAHGYTNDTVDGSLADATRWSPSWTFAAGSVYSTLADLRVWTRALATGALLSPRMQAERLSWVTPSPLAPGFRYGLGIAYSKGWLMHNGEVPGYNAAIYHYPPLDATVVVLLNRNVPAPFLTSADQVVAALVSVVLPDHLPCTSLPPC